MSIDSLVRQAAGWIVVVVATGSPSAVAAQAPQAARPQGRPVSVHRPWVGIGAGLGGVLGNTPAEGTHGLLAATFDVPLTSLNSVRFSVERLWSSVEGYGGLRLRQFSADLLVRKPTGTLYGCSMFTVLGFGPGIYDISLEAADLSGSTRVGYQLTLAQECIQRRFASGGALGLRFVRMPDHPAFDQALDVAMTLSWAVRIRL